LEGARAVKKPQQMDKFVTRRAVLLPGGRA